MGQGLGVGGKQVWKVKSGDLLWMWLCLKYLLHKPTGDIQ